MYTVSFFSGHDVEAVLGVVVPNEHWTRYIIRSSVGVAKLVTNRWTSCTECYNYASFARR